MAPKNKKTPTNVQKSKKRQPVRKPRYKPRFTMVPVRYVPSLPCGILQTTATSGGLNFMLTRSNFIVDENGHGLRPNFQPEGPCRSDTSSCNYIRTYNIMYTFFFWME